MSDDDFYDDEADDNPFDDDRRCGDCRCVLRGVTEFVYGFCEDCMRVAKATRDRKDA